MKFEHRGLLSAGAFASLCSTTKETLRHYHRLGILSPVSVAENGYHYYAVTQFFDFYLISTLKAAGSSLEEIRDYLIRPGNEAYLAMLRRKRAALREEQRKLARMERLLTQSIRKMEQALDGTALYRPWLEECGETCLAAVPVSTVQELSDPEAVEVIRTLLELCARRGLCNEFQFGAVLPRDAFLSGRLQISHYYTALSRRAAGEGILIRPAGTYVNMLYDANGDPEEAHVSLMAYLAQNGLTVCGDAYDEELTVYQSNYSDQALYAVRISAPVCGPDSRNGAGSGRGA